MNVERHNPKCLIMKKSKEHKCPKARGRFRMVYLAMMGWKIREIAVETGYSSKSICKWVARYNELGIKGITGATSGRGRPPFLNESQTRRLVAYLTKCSLRDGASGPEIKEWIQEKFGVSYSQGGVYHLIDRLGFS